MGSRRQLTSPAFGFAAVAAVLLATAAIALASTGALTAKGCIADPAHNVDGCGQTTKGLDSPFAVAVSADGTSVYVAGAGDAAIVRFDRNPNTGALTPKGCVADPANNPDGCAQTAKGLGGVQSIAVSADGKSVYATGSSLVRFRRDPTTGALTPKGCIGDLTSNPDGCAQTARGLDGVFSVVVSDDGKSVYAAGNLANAIVRFNRDTNGALTPAGCIASMTDNPAACPQTTRGLDTPQRIAVSHDGTSVYVSGVSDRAIVRFARNTNTGALTPKGCIADTVNNPANCGQTTPGLNGVRPIAVSRDGKSVYAAGRDDNSVVLFRRSLSSGALTPEGCVADPANNPAGCTQTAKGLDFALGVIVSDDGKSVYAAGLNDNAVVRFDRNQTTGALTPRGCIANPATNPDACAETARGLRSAIGLAASHDGDSLYVTGLGSNAIVRFSRQP